MIYAPIYYDKLNNIESSYIPSMVKSRNTLTYGFWERSLFHRAMSTIILDVPDEWSGNIKDYLYFVLFRCGYAAVFRRDDMGVIFSHAGLHGFNFYYQPTNALIVNPAIPESLDLVIGKDCELIKLTPDYMGIWDIIAYYAEKLSTLDGAINMSIINNKLAWIIGAKNKAAAATIKKAIDKINRGEPAVVLDEKLMNDATSKDEPWQFLERTHIKNSYITSDQLMDFQTLLNNFDTEIGIPVLPYQKKERMVTSEAESKVIDATSRSVVWYDSLSNSIAKVNDMFNIGLSVRLRYDPKDYQDNEEVADNGIG